MRVLLLALMIALLPLRGWVGDVMAMEPSMQGPGAHAVVMPDCHEAHTMATPHQGHAMAGADKAAVSPDGAAQADCGSCSLCQICHSVALAPVLPQLPAARLPSAAPTSGQPLYVNAERALGDKPPIS